MFALIICRQYFRGARCTSELKLDGKVAIITGGNGGIGRYVAEDFLKRGDTVLAFKLVLNSHNLKYKLNEYLFEPSIC